MRNARTIKSRIAAIDKRIGSLPPLVTIKISTPEGKIRALALEPIDAMIALVDELARDGEERTQFADRTPYDGHIIGVEADDPEEPVTRQALGIYESILERREEDPAALC